jgi:hypothetical protein
MHEPYDEDDEYHDDQYDYDNQNMWYFKFDISQNPSFSKWVQDIVNNIINPLDNSIMDSLDKAWGVENKNAYVFPVNSWNPNTGNDKKFQYLGSNYAGEPVWKSKYWVINPVNQSYKSHLQSHAAHFINQPKYYKGLFDILN